MRTVLSRLRLRHWGVGALLGLVTALFGCATPPRAPLPPQVLQDHLFEPPENPPRAESVFAMSPAMLQYAQTQLRPGSRSADLRHQLLDALYTRGGLQLDYDSTITRTAAEAFDARAGNCLSLVIMTASFARHLGLPVSFQLVSAEDFYTRRGNLTLANTHVNLVLGSVLPRTQFRTLGGGDDTLIVDFIPARDLKGQLSLTLEEQTILAMYFNNRAAEELAQGRINDAYWFARQALQEDPSYTAAANTLGVVYDRAGHPQAAENAFRHVLALAPNTVNGLNNLAQLLDRQGASAEAAVLRARLAQLQPVPPFKRYFEGRQAMAEGAFARARDLFREELRLQPFQDEVHFWAAQAAWQLGRTDEAAQHLRHALENSLTRSDQSRYSAKLEHLRGAARTHRVQ
jgi:tetratricopeptide (TPR) repeat protein